MCNLNILLFITIIETLYKGQEKSIFMRIYIIIFLLLSQIIYINGEENKLIFKDIIIEQDVKPFEEFKVSAIVKNVDSIKIYENVIVKLVAPPNINVLSDIVRNLGSVEPNVEKIVSWSLVSQQPGSYIIKLIIYSNNQEINSFEININIGKVNPIIVEDINLPGNIKAGDKFNYTITIKNVANYPINNVIFTIVVGMGLHLIDDVAKRVDIKANESITLNWSIRADTTGSFKVIVNYFTPYKESNSFETFVNVGDVKNIGNIIITKAYWGVEKEILALPGSKNVPLTIILTNVGDLPLDNIHIELRSDKHIKINDNIKELQVLQPSKEIPLTFLADIIDDTDIGLYKIDVILRSKQYEQEKLTEVYLKVTDDIPVTITLKDIKREGDIFRLKIDVYNNSSETLRNINILTSNLTKSSYIDSLSPYHHKELWLSIILPSREYDYTISLPIRLTYIVNGVSLTSEDIIYIPITDDILINALDIERISVEPLRVYNGNNAKIIINLKNNDLFPYKNIYGKLLLENGFTPTYGGSTEIYLDKIMPDTIASLYFFINIGNDVLPGDYNFKLMITYNNRTAEYNIPFTVSPKANFNILSVDSTQLYTGSTNVPLKVTIKNSGSSDAKNIQLKLLGGNVLPGSKSTFITTTGDVEIIGRLNQEQSYEATFIVNVDRSAKIGINTINLEISWEQDDGNKFSDVITLPIEIYSNSYSFNIMQHPELSILLVVTGSGAAILIILLRKRRINSMN